LLQQSPHRREVFCEGLFRVLNARPHMDDESLHSTGTHNELAGDPNFTALSARCPASDASDRSVR